MTDENAKLRVLANLGRFAMLGDENERAVVLGRPALALAEKLGRDEMRAHVLNNIGVARVALGEREGLDDLEASLEIARRAGGPEHVRACGNLASVLACEGQLQRSAELHREGLQMSQEIGYEEPTRWLWTESQTITCSPATGKRPGESSTSSFPATKNPRSGWSRKRGSAAPAC